MWDRIVRETPSGAKAPVFTSSEGDDMASKLRKRAARLLPFRLKDLMLGRRFRAEQRADGRVEVEQYWTEHTVHVKGDALVGRESSRAYFDWRCSEYPGYLDLMPVAGHDGERILDYGCGPGHDLVGFLEYSRPASLVGADVSPTALAIASRRVRLHPGGDETVLVRAGNRGELSDHSSGRFDYIHSSGVLHHLDAPLEVLRSFKNMLAADGRIRLMVYNRDSIWRNFYVPYVLQYRRRAIDRALTIDDAFRMSTDGPDCPVARSYDPVSIGDLAQAAGLKCQVIGTSISKHELRIWRDYRELARRDRRTDPAVAAFVESVGNDASGMPVDASGRRPGINLVVELAHS